MKDYCYAVATIEMEHMYAKRNCLYTAETIGKGLRKDSLKKSMENDTVAENIKTNRLSRHCYDN